MIVGIYGCQGSGKTTACKVLAEKFDALHIEIDSIVDFVLVNRNASLNELVQRMIAPTPEYRRCSSREIADSFFSSDMSQLAYDYALKRMVEAEVIKAISHNDEERLVLLDWAFLPYSPLFYLCDYLIEMNASNELRHSRLSERKTIFCKTKEAYITAGLERVHARPHLKVKTDKQGWEVDLVNRFHSVAMSPYVITVVIPVYNCEEHLARCIESVTNQSFRNLDIIIVDDGSTDCSGDIAEFYAARDSRIRVIHQDNQGLSRARNIGISCAKGTYLGFVDADDYLEQHAYETLLSKAIAADASAVSCRAFIHARFCDEVGGAAKGQADSLLIQGVKENLEAYVNGDMTFAVWDKLFLTETIKDVRFSDEVFNEDADFMLQYAMKGTAILCITDQLYHHVKTSGNTLTGVVFDSRLFLTSNWAEKQASKLESVSPAYSDIAIRLRYNSFSHVIKCFMRDYSQGCQIADYRDALSYVSDAILDIALNYKRPTTLIDLENTLDIINHLTDEGYLRSMRKPKKVACIGVIWNSLSGDLMEQAIQMLRCRATVRSVSMHTMDTRRYSNFIDDIYYFNDEREPKEGTAYFKKCTTVDRYDSNTIALVYLEIEVTSLVFNKKKEEFNYLEIMALKDTIRNYFKKRIKDYAFDNVFHLTVNEEEYEYTDRVCKGYFNDSADVDIV